jgi:hypothetical protein
VGRVPIVPVRRSGAVSGILFEPFNEIELGKQASIAVNVGSTVRAEMKVRDVLKSCYVRGVISLKNCLCPFRTFKR